MCVTDAAKLAVARLSRVTGMRCVDDYKQISKKFRKLLKSVCGVRCRDGVVCADEERFEDRKRQQDGYM